MASTSREDGDNTRSYTLIAKPNFYLIIYNFEIADSVQEQLSRIGFDPPTH